MSRVKFSAFADLHHFPGVFYSRAEERLEIIRRRAEDEKVDFVISLGDFCHNVKKSAHVIKQYADFPMPVYHVLGNHDADETTFEEVLQAYRMENDFYSFDRNGFRFIVLNSSNLLVDGEYIHYSLGNYFKHPDKREYFSWQAIDWLAGILQESPLPCILFSHASLERESDGGDGSVHNRDQVIPIIREANRRCPGKVRMAINGHMHRNGLSIQEDVVYLDLNSTTFDWLPTPHNFFPEEITGEYNLSQHTVIVNEPVHAVIELDTDGTVKIDGMKSTFFMGVTREMTDNPKLDQAGRPASAEVLSAHFKMFYN